MALLAEAFGAIGDVPARVLADRMACLTGGVVANMVISTAGYVRLAGHTRASRRTSAMPPTQSNGIVGNLCGYAQRDPAIVMPAAALQPRHADTTAVIGTAWLHKAK